MMKYFDVHVIYGKRDSDGYSIFIKGNDLTEENCIDYAIKNKLFEEDGDEEYVDYVEEIDEDEYKEATEW